MKLRKIIALALSALMSLSIVTVTASAQSNAATEGAAEEKTEGVISLPFTDYTNEISSGRDTAYLENVIKDGKDVVMCTPNPKSEAATDTITIDGYKYKPVNINLDEYRWFAIEYYYQSPEPIADLRMSVSLTGLGNLLKENVNVTAKSQDILAANTWAVAVFDMNSVIDTALNPDVSHVLQQLHVQPYGRSTRNLLKETDVMYISRIMFFDEQPAFNSHTPYMNGYEDATFRPAGTMTRAEACTVVARLLEAEENIAGAASFADVAADQWYAKYIGFCEAKGLLGSYSGNFEPSKPITRAEFSELVYLTGLAQDKGIAASFTDVAADHPKYTSIMAAASAGLINGYLEENGTYTFKPDNTITRAEVVTVINRARGLSKTADALTSDITVLFVDVDHTHWAFADIAEATVPHVESNDAWLYPVKDPILAIEEKIGTSSLYDTALGYAKIAELDELEAKRIEEIRNTPNMDLSGITGKKIYVSNNGSDENDGLTPATAVKTVAKGNSLATNGDAVLFERGGLWREKINAKANVTYTAYGEGAKPMLYGSTENGADPEKWGLVYENKETGALIWQYHYDGWLDIGTIVFNEGEGYAYKDMPDNKPASGKFTVYKSTKDYDYTVELDKNFEFFHKADSIISGSYIDPANAKGPIYLRCDNGNPGEIFDSIEFVTRGSIIPCVGFSDITIDNLCLKYSAFGISAGTIKNLKVTNCEFQWIGGNIHSYSMQSGVATRYGNAIEVYGGCDGYTVDNCYFYQIYDAAVTHQIGSASAPLQMNNITYSNNVMDMCQYSIEYFLGSDAPGKRTGTNVLFENNLCRRAGFGFGSTRRDQYTQRHIRGGGSRNEFTDFRINNNIFDRAVFELVQTNCHEGAIPPTYDGNTYIQGVNNQLYSHGVGKVAKTDAAAAFKIRSVLGDQNAQVYFVDHIPMYKYEFNYEKTAPVTEADKREFESTLEAQDPTKIIIPEGETTEVTAPLVERMQKVKTLYTVAKPSMSVEPITDSNGIVYAHTTFFDTSDTVLFDCYGIPKYSVKSPALYYKVLLRTNVKDATPIVTVYGLRDEAGEPAGTGNAGTSKTKLLGNGEWEEVIIQVMGIPAEAATSNQIHLQPLGRVKGTDVLSANPSAYVDVAAWAAFSNLASAEAYDIKKAAGKIDGAADNVPSSAPSVPSAPSVTPGSTTTPTTQEPAGSQGETTGKVSPLVFRMHKTKGLGNVKPSMTAEDRTDPDGLVYSHITFENTNDTILFDAYGLPKYSVKSPALYFRMLIRTNVKGTPIVTVYGLQDEAGNPAGAGTVAVAETPILANGEWEDVIIKVTGIPAAAATSSQVHLQPLGRVKGSDFYSAGVPKNADAYLDIAAWAAFSSLEAAQTYDMRTPASVKK